MTQATILLMNQSIRRFKPFFDTAKQKDFASANRKTYTEACTLNTTFVGAQAAEEMFDLTNNPGRQDEREELYGRGPSVSSGDIVRVDGIDYLCCSIGWEKLSS